MAGITVKKSENFSEWFTQIVSPQGADLADVRFGLAGFLVHMPWAMRIIRKIYDYLESEVEEDGHEPYLFPIAIKKEYLEKEEKHAGFAPDVFWVTKGGTNDLDEPFALRPTGETQIYPLYALWLRTHKQLPYKRYQSRHTVYRNEMTTRPFLRGREFLFFETHNMYRTHEEAMKQIETDMHIMESVIGTILKIPFVFIQRPKWDAFLGANNTYVADTLMPDGKRNQLSSTHDLGTNFAKPFDITYTDADETIKHPEQTCFGPGIWRIMAALIGIHGDDTGLILPSSVAPHQVVIVPITFKGKDNEKILESCGEVKETLKKAGIRTHIDSSEESPGWKYNQWEMKGVPVRIEIGPRDIELHQVMAVTRTHKDKQAVRRDDVTKKIPLLLKQVDRDIEDAAKKYFEDSTRTAETLERTIEIIKEFRGFVKVPFCSRDIDGEGCANILKDKTSGGACCGTPFKDPETPANKACIVCDKPAKVIMWVAKSY